MKESDLHASQLQYLYVIYELSLHHDKVRQKDVAHEMAFSRASVSIAIHNLMDLGLIKNAKKEVILTSLGKRWGHRLYDHVEKLSKFMDIKESKWKLAPLMVYMKEK